MQVKTLRKNPRSHDFQRDFQFRNVTAELKCARQ